MNKKCELKIYDMDGSLIEKRVFEKLEDATFIGRLYDSYEIEEIEFKKSLD